MRKEHNCISHQRQRTEGNSEGFFMVLFQNVRLIFATILYCIHYHQAAVLYLGHMSQSTSPAFS